MIVLNREVTRSDYRNRGRRYGRMQVQGLAAKRGKASWPWLKAAQPIPGVHCLAREIDESVFAPENGCKSGLLVVLRARRDRSVLHAGKSADHQLSSGLRQARRKR